MPYGSFGDFVHHVRIILRDNRFGPNRVLITVPDSWHRSNAHDGFDKVPIGP